MAHNIKHTECVFWYVSSYILVFPYRILRLFQSLLYIDMKTYLSIKRNL